MKDHVTVHSLDFHLWDVTKLQCLNEVGDRTKQPGKCLALLFHYFIDDVSFLWLRSNFRAAVEDVKCNFPHSQVLHLTIQQKAA